MGRIFSPPSPPPPPPLPPVEPPAPPLAPAPVEAPSAAPDPAEQARREAELRRRRGQAAFIATGPRGLLAEQRRAPLRKTLLGE